MISCSERMSDLICAFVAFAEPTKRSKSSHRYVSPVGRITWDVEPGVRVDRSGHCRMRSYCRTWRKTSRAMSIGARGWPGMAGFLKEWGKGRNGNPRSVDRGTVQPGRRGARYFAPMALPMAATRRAIAMAFMCWLRWPRL